MGKVLFLPKLSASGKHGLSFSLVKLIILVSSSNDNRTCEDVAALHL